MEFPKKKNDYKKETRERNGYLRVAPDIVPRCSAGWGNLTVAQDTAFKAWKSGDIN